MTISKEMDILQDSLYLEQVPEAWAVRAYPSLSNLAQWYTDLLLRIRELESWVVDFKIPCPVWISGLFNPQSFLTAIMQTTARKNELPLDKMVLSIDEMKRIEEFRDSVNLPGVFCTGFFLEGARWDCRENQLVESKLKEINQPMPPWLIKAISLDRRNEANSYECPVYRTKLRGSTYVWTFNLKTRENPLHWIIGGVCLLMQV